METAERQKKIRKIEDFIKIVNKKYKIIDEKTEKVEAIIDEEIIDSTIEACKNLKEAIVKGKPDEINVAVENLKITLRTKAKRKVVKVIKEDYNPKKTLDTIKKKNHKKEYIFEDPKTLHVIEKGEHKKKVRLDFMNANDYISSSMAGEFNEEDYDFGFFVSDDTRGFDSNEDIDEDEIDFFSIEKF